MRKGRFVKGLSAFFDLYRENLDDYFSDKESIIKRIKKNPNLLSLNDISNKIANIKKNQAIINKKRISDLNKVLSELKLDKALIKKIINNIENLDKFSTESLFFDLDYIYVKTKVLTDILEISPQMNNHFKGKTPKAKKPEQIKAEEWAKEVWDKHPETSQAQMAIDIKDGEDLPQTIKTIIGWIKHLDPQKGMRKRKSKKMTT